MERRKFIQDTAGFGLVALPFTKVWQRFRFPFSVMYNRELSGPQKPVFIYNNWSAYDELSDNVAQTEALAMQELNEIIRLKTSGVEIDYYVMDAFWFDIDGGYRTWHKQHWPNGPDKWLAVCKENNIIPGMWFSTNLVAMGGKTALAIIPEWGDSVGTDPNILCLFDGGYLNHLSATLQIWYNKGVRLFKFDFAYFEAVTSAMKDKYSPDEIKEKNKVAFMNMLQHFRAKNPDVLITGYNGFGGDMENTYTAFDKKIDPRWLDTFDTLYCGDPRFSDVPMMNVWRSQDNYSDHQISAYKAYGMPMRRIDNCAFMIGKTGTCYYRATHCWKGMLILELARGGWVNVYHGNLELLNDDDAKWFAKTQSLYRELQQQDKFSTFGAIPGKGMLYGFKAAGKMGEVFTVINPSQEIATIILPSDVAKSKLLYADGGYKPLVKGNSLTLGPEQLVVVGFGGYANEDFDLGTDETIRIPHTISTLNVLFKETGKNTLESAVHNIPSKNIRIVLQQFDANGLPHRSWGGAPPDGKKISEFIKIVPTQNGKEVQMHIGNDRVIWSGLSWAVGEIDKKDIDRTNALNILCISTEKESLRLRAEIYAVGYE
jgi:hypothetical protein